MVSELIDVFPKNVPSLLPNMDTNFDFDVDQSTQPISLLTYQMELVVLIEFVEKFKNLLSNGFIMSSISLWGTHFFYIIKNGSLQMCIDYT